MLLSTSSNNKFSASFIFPSETNLPSLVYKISISLIFSWSETYYCNMSLLKKSLDKDIAKLSICLSRKSCLSIFHPPIYNFINYYINLLINNNVSRYKYYTPKVKD